MTTRSLLRHVGVIKWWQLVCPACFRIHGPVHLLVRWLGGCRGRKGVDH